MYQLFDSLQIFFRFEFPVIPEKFGRRKGKWQLQSVLLYTYFFLSNLGQASALEVAYIFKDFGAQSSLMVA